MKKIAIGSDHVGVDLKRTIMVYLQELGYNVVDYGPNVTERTDYPIYAKRVAESITQGDNELGILICGTGVGMSIVANKVQDIRCVVCSEPYSAKLSKAHNNTNILAFGARVVGEELAKMIVSEWLATNYEVGRHETRLQLITDLEACNETSSLG